MPLVLIEWGLEPHTDPRQMAILDDRHIGLAPPVPVVGGAIPEGRTVTISGDWFDGQGVIFLIGGILNPNGQRLCLGQKRINGKWRIFARWLHMLGGQTTYAAKSDPNPFSYQDICEEAASIQNHLIGTGDKGLMESIPSFLVTNRGDERDRRDCQVAHQRGLSPGPFTRD